MLRVLALGAAALLFGSALATTDLPSLTAYTGSNRVESNFFGISIELSAIDSYVGNSTSTIPSEAITYFSNIRSRTGRPLRMRIGGNSMDDSTYNPSQANMITLNATNATTNDQPTTFGPLLFDVLNDVSNKIGGAQYLLGLSLIFVGSSNIPLLASAIEQSMNGTLDGFLLGNEPDLYGPHYERQYNYTIDNYIEDFKNATASLMNSTEGNLLSSPLLGAPSTCCNWDLNDVLTEGFMSNFSSEMKYINVQHYPQNNCNDTHKFGIDYYLQHQLVVQLSNWSLTGVHTARAANKSVTMGEFNTASCGGIPGISDTFAATMWTVDYVLQLAAVGYSGAYIHTRERGVTYNLFESPVPGNGTAWTTRSPYYALLPVAEALNSANGSYVVDLNIANSTAVNGTMAGYAVYDGSTGAPSSLVLFNYADKGTDPASFSIPQVPNTTKLELTVRYLTATSLAETAQIAWGGKTLAGVGNGELVSSSLGPDVQVSCASGCTVQVPSPGVAVVFFNMTSANVQSVTSLAFPSRIASDFASLSLLTIFIICVSAWS